MQVFARSCNCFPGSAACLTAQACRLTTQTQQWPQRWQFSSILTLGGPPDCVCMQADCLTAAVITTVTQLNPPMHLLA